MLKRLIFFVFGEFICLIIVFCCPSYTKLKKLLLINYY